MEVSLGEQEDREIKCDCGKIFTLTVGEQKFFTSKALKYPRRCKECRVKRKAEAAARAEADVKRKEDEAKSESSPFHPKNIRGYQE